MHKTREILGHVPELDGVRGIAVLIVMIRHFYTPVESALPFGVLDKVLVHGASGVDLFFVLSGFLITGILVSTKQATNYFQAFYARRALRILPLYVLVLIFFFWIAVPLLHHMGKEGSIKPTDQLYYWFFLANWLQALHPGNNGAQLGHFWSLGIEEQFYICWSLVVWFASTRHIKSISIAVFVASISCHLVLICLGWNAVFLDRSTVTRIDGLALGSMLAVWPAFREWVGRYAVLATTVAVITAIVMPWRQYDFLVYDLGATSLVALAFTRTVPLLKLSWLRLFGKYSYGLYVIHYIINGLEFKMVGRMNPLALGLISIPAGIGLSFAAAWASWRWLEEPFLKLKGNFNYRFAEDKSAAPLPRGATTLGLR